MIIQKAEIDNVINSIPEIKYERQKSNKAGILRGMTEKYIKQIPVSNSTKPKEFIVNLLDEIIEVYKGEDKNKTSVDVLEVYKKTVKNECAKNCDAILSNTLFEFTYIFPTAESHNKTLPLVYYGNVGEDLEKCFNMGIREELSVIEKSCDPSDKLVYSLVGEACNWVLDNNKEVEFIGKMYSEKGINDIVEKLNKTYDTFFDIMEHRDEIKNNINESEWELRCEALDIMTPIEYLNELIIGDLEAIEKLTSDECYIRDYVNTYKAIIEECNNQAEMEIEEEMGR